MATNFNPLQVERFRREAKKLGRELSIPHSEALNRIAVQNGFTNWSLLSKHSIKPKAVAHVPFVPRVRSELADSIRHYLHGDVTEQDATQCFCARCDDFLPTTHLSPVSSHADGKDEERYLADLARWNGQAAAYTGRRHRPADAANVFVMVPRKGDRHYVHGDVAEDDAARCYCARCDAFVPFAHLLPTSSHGDGKDRERYLSGLANWTKSAAAKSGRRYRPSSAPNILAIAARAATIPAEGVRHYLHGDVVESNLSLCYCARCDDFVPFTHLVPISSHADGNDGKRFLSALAAWNRITDIKRGRWYRPDDAPNILAGPTRAAEATYASARSPFHRWLDAQTSRDDPVGDLAVALLRDKNFPIAVTTRQAVEAYLSRRGEHVLQAVREAWAEFLADSQG